MFVSNDGKIFERPKGFKDWKDILFTERFWNLQNDENDGCE